VWSRLSAHLQPFFLALLRARILTFFFYKKYCILTCGDKRESYWLLLDLCLSLSGSLWLSVTPSLALTATLWHTLALSGSLLLSNFAYTALDRLTGPLLGSHRSSSRGWRNLLRPPALTPFLGHPVVIFTFSLWPPSSIQSLPYYEVIIVGIIQNPVVVCIVLYPLFSVHLLASPHIWNRPLKSSTSSDHYLNPIPLSKRIWSQ